MKNNRSGNVLLGLTLIFVGLAWMLLKLGYLDDRAIMGLAITWPLVFVIFGLGVIFKNRVLTSILWIIFIIATISYGYVFDKQVENFEISYSDHEIVEDYNGGKMELNIAAGNILITSTENQLISSEYPEFISEDFDVKDGKVKFEYKDTTKGYFDFIQRTNEEFKFKLNDDLNWDIDIDCGAMDGTFDLRDIYINNLEIDTGASDITLYLSEKSDLSTIDIDNGVSDIVVFVPDGVGVSLDYDGAIKDVDIEEDSWSKKDGYYYSPGYEESLKKTIILVDSGVGSIEFKFLDSDE
ncbi:MAG: cell wall-active antibiotics response protein [Firmicutes bacterium]|jgi:hypothetical protein|nr:cell wall-active antibiotics response protein [Bacillota bacterium]